MDDGALMFDDPIEALFARGVTDGLPVVPPTRARVDAMIAGAGRAADVLIGQVAPQYGRATVEKIAVNAVMAGCRPEYMSVVVAAVAAICDPAFGLEGVSGTTDAVAPLVVVNGPVRLTIGLNCGVGVFGPGWRANATIGRALRLVWANVGGARPGVISMSTFSQPGRYTYCIGEYEEASPWPALHVEHGFARDESTVAVLAAEAPQQVVNSQGRTAKDIVATIAKSAAMIASETQHSLGDTLIVIGPEHARTIAGDGWRKDDVRAAIFDATRALPKFRAPANVKVLVAGGTAGRFSVLVPGWPFPDAPTRLVFKRVGA